MFTRDTGQIQLVRQQHGWDILYRDLGRVLLPLLLNLAVQCDIRLISVSWYDPSSCTAECWGARRRCRWQRAGTGVACGQRSYLLLNVMMRLPFTMLLRFFAWQIAMPWLSRRWLSSFVLCRCPRKMNKFVSVEPHQETHHDMRIPERDLTCIISSV